MPRVARNRPKIATKAFARMVADNSGYKVYEVEDIMKWIALTLQMQLIECNTVEFRGIGTWMTVERTEKRRFVSLLNREVVTPAEITVAYRTDSDIRQAVSKDSPLRKLGEANGS